jgi:hypothetical protein
MANAEKISYAYDLGGGQVPVIIEFDIATGTVIEQGEIVVMNLATGLVTAIGDADQDDPYLGVAAEGHTGAADTFNPRNNGLKIKVYCSPTAVFKCKPATVSTCDSGTATNWVDGELVAGAGFADDSFSGGFLKLVEKAALSTLTIPVGWVGRIKDFTVAAGTIIMETGALEGAASAGDKALLFPAPVSLGWDLNSDGTNLDLKAKGGESIRIVDVDTDLEYVYFMLRLHQLGNSTLSI